MRKLLLLAVTLCSVISYSQEKLAKDFTYKVGEPYKVVNAPARYFFFNGKEILAAKFANDHLTLQKFDAKTLKLIKRNDIHDIPKLAQFLYVGKIKNHYYFFYSDWNVFSHNAKLFCREIDFANCKLKGDAKCLINPNKKMVSYQTLYEPGLDKVPGPMNVFGIYFSPDTNNILIKYQLKPKLKSDAISHETDGLYVFDSDLNKKWGKDVVMPYDEKRTDNLKYTLDNEGNIYLMAKIYNNDSPKIVKQGTHDPNYHLEFIKFKANTAAIQKTTVVPLGHKFINQVWLYKGGHDTINCVGYYDGYNQDDEGILFIQFDQDGNIIRNSADRIPEEIREQNATPTSKTKDSYKDFDDIKAMDNMEIKRLVYGDKGSVIIFGEQQFFTGTNYSINYGNSTSFHETYSVLHCNAILVTKIDADGQIEWARKIPKRQISEGKGCTSFMYLFNKGNQYVLYYDNPDNLNLNKKAIPQPIVGQRDAELIGYKINDTNGNMGKSLVLNTENVDGTSIFRLAVNRGVRISPDDFVIEAFIGIRRDILIKIHTLN